MFGSAKNALLASALYVPLSWRILTLQERAAVEIYSFGLLALFKGYSAI
jgi:hypothetical protein